MCAYCLWAHLLTLNWAVDYLGYVHCHILWAGLITLNYFWLIFLSLRRRRRRNFQVETGFSNWLFAHLTHIHRALFSPWTLIPVYFFHHDIRYC